MKSSTLVTLSNVLFNHIIDSPGKWKVNFLPLYNFGLHTASLPTWESGLLARPYTEMVRCL